MVWSAIIVIWAASFVIAGLLECGTHLLAIFGTPQAYLAHCGSAIPSGYAMVATDILTDFITLAIPVPIILSLQMDVPTKALTLFIFMIGALSVFILSSTFAYLLQWLSLSTCLYIVSIDLSVRLLLKATSILRRAWVFTPKTRSVSFFPSMELDFASSTEAEVKISNS